MPKVNASLFGLHRALLFVFVVGALAVAVAAGFHTFTEPAPTTGVLRTVPAARPASVGIALTRVSTPSSIGRVAAVRTALKPYAGATAREVVLVRMTDSNRRPHVTCLCWAVSIAPPGGVLAPSGGGDPLGASALPGSYSVQFVGARTGAFVEGVSGG